jgi:hypothetical protein
VASPAPSSSCGTSMHSGFRKRRTHAAEMELISVERFFWLAPSPQSCAGGIWTDALVKCLPHAPEPTRPGRGRNVHWLHRFRDSRVTDDTGPRRLQSPHAVLHGWQRPLSDAQRHCAHCRRLFRTPSPGPRGHPFADNDGMDIVLRAGPREQMLDIAVTCAFRQTDGPLTKAAEAPGGWATSYESVKCNALQDLIPVVFGTFGAAGVSARPACDDHG